MSDYYDEQPVTIETKLANERWDVEQGGHSVTMDPHVPLRARRFDNMVGAPLTDKKIEKYREAGYYSQAYREARKEAMERKRNRRFKREGNFLVYPDGRKVFAPE